jgi:hypothetical protein
MFATKDLFRLYRASPKSSPLSGVDSFVGGLFARV